LTLLIYSGIKTAAGFFYFSDDPPNKKIDIQLFFAVYANTIWLKKVCGFCVIYDLSQVEYN
jgi:hypothetical protein